MDNLPMIISTKVPINVFAREMQEFKFRLRIQIQHKSHEAYEKNSQDEL
jgi:hypothetical protein